MFSVCSFERNIDYFLKMYAVVVQLVEALHYKPEGRGFDSLLDIGIFH
jgi:hypothetical protein